MVQKPSQSVKKKIPESAYFKPLSGICNHILSLIDLPPKKNKLKCEQIYDIQSFDCFTQFEAEGELPPVKQKLR